MSGYQQDVRRRRVATRSDGDPASRSRRTGTGIADLDAFAALGSNRGKVAAWLSRVNCRNGCRYH
jgi:hypothetical protein